LRVAEKVKKIKSNIKTVHYVAPQVWIWRKNRVKKIKKFIDHILLLFNFEKKYFDEENIKNTFVGHPLIETKNNPKTLIEDLIPNHKKIISLFPGSRKSETLVLLPILISFIELMNKKHKDYFFYFHATEENKNSILDIIKQKKIENIDVISEENIKSEVLSKSIFAVSKSGTVSLQICNANIPSIIIYKLSFINFMIFKMLVNVKFANIINIINNREIIPELLQNECNAKEIYKTVIYFLKNPDLIKKQLAECNKTLDGIRSKTSSSDESSTVLFNYLVS
jgi:lipid-A-disaccharide synthase